MSRATATDLVYLVAIVGFIFALIGLSSPKHARIGNLAGAAGMLVAVAWTFSLPSVYGHTKNILLIIIAVVIGTAIGVPAARMVKMTAMPQMVAIFNGVGGGAAALVSVTEFIHVPDKKTFAIYKICEILFGVLVGAVSFAGSGVAFAKLQELMTGRPITYKGQQPINAAVGVAILAMLIATVVTANTTLLIVVLVLSLVLGVIFVLPIGGADVPVLISLLNSFTGLAVAASGFILDSNLLIVAGTLVGASGILLTRMMSTAMGRSIGNILFSAFGSVITATGADGGPDGRTVRTGTAEDIGVLLAYARKVAIIPGYGLAVAQAQHVARELAAYSGLVTPGCYLIVEDTNVNGRPVLPGFGPGPAEALETFLATDDGFEVDRTREKLLMTFNPGGFLRRRMHS